MICSCKAKRTSKDRAIMDWQKKMLDRWYKT